MSALAATRVVALLLVALPTLCASTECVSSEEHSGLFHLVQTDECIYAVPDSVRISYSVTNVTSDPIEIGWSWRCSPLQLIIYDPDQAIIWAEPNSCPDETWIDTLAVGDYYVKEATWDMRIMPGGDLVQQEGVYTIRAKLKTFYPSLYFWVEHPIEILGESSGLPGEPARWGRIKALYR